MENQIAEFTRIHDEFIIDWNNALETGDASSIERMREDYYAILFNETNEKPVLVGREDAILCIRESVKQLLGTKKKCKNRVIRMKDSKNVAVFYELLIENEEKVLARLFTIETWQLIDGKWMLVRVVEEPLILKME
ncbi:hypothetical protein [Bacillus sp. 1P02SD]|uniref:hypothetical protein n=1 Tax=Bacillus sp. 1P02SD TaxID=3132264 RepID=UPI00399F83AE